MWWTFIWYASILCEAYNVIFYFVATKPEKVALLTHLTCVSAKWYEMGGLLGVDSNTLDGLYSANSSNDVKLSKMLQNWLDNEPTSVTWENILRILEGPLEKKSVADKIRKSLGMYTVLYSTHFSVILLLIIWYCFLYLDSTPT